MAEITRSQAPIEATWKRETTFASWQAWDAQFEQAKAGLPELKAWSGRLAVGPAALADWFEVYDRHAVSLGELGGFVGWAVTVDGSDEEANRRQGLFGALDAEFDATVAFALPQMLAVGEQLLDWAQQEPRLAKYRHYLHNLLRLQQNTRSEEVEELLGMVNDPFSLTYRSFSELTNTDLKFADAVDAAGDHHPIFQSSYGSSIQSVDRTRRRSAWENYFDGYLGMQNTLAAMYLGNVKQQEFLRKARGFDSVLEMRLAPTNLPVQVFRNLIDVFTDNLPTWHRYWAVKSKLLGLERMAPYDIWAPILQKVPTVPYAQAVEWICDALRPLGQDYVATMRAGSLQERWVDWVPNKEKRQGAASSRMVGRKPPYIFMSYNDTVFSLSTLAHELGHSMHSHAFARHQPIVYNDYGAISSTVTETASNFQQAMARAYLRKQLAGDANFQLAMVDEAMSNFHRYFFIMPTLARFEEEVYSRAKAGKPLSASIFNGILMEYFTEGYGNTLQDDPARTAVTWAQFLHLYIPFYSFQYAVGISAAHAIAEKVLADQPGAVADYHSFLQAGGSLYAMDLFDLAGVDMSSRAPIEAAFRELEANVVTLERLAEQ